MSDPTPSPQPYRVAYSGLVRTELRTLLARAASRGLAKQLAAAVRTMDERLRIYPQFGEPLRDLQHGSAQVRIACFPPLVVRYWLDEAERTVIVAVPFMPLRRSGLEP